MKLFGLYHQQTKIGALEANHRKFCEINKAEYRSYRIANYYEKYRLIYHLLQEYPGETLLFIDSNSYFTTFEWKFNLDRDLFLQEKDGGVLDNFIIARSTPTVISLFSERIIPSLIKQTFNNRHTFTLPCPPIPMIPKEELLPYPYKENGVHLNINALVHFEDLAVLVRHIHVGDIHYPESYAGMLCEYIPDSYPISNTPIEIINPGKRNALVTLHTKEIERMGSISEQNVADYCKRNDITYYIYRQIPEHLRHLSGTWCKPYLLLNHLPQHDYLGWIDSDILITPGYRMDFCREISVYNDPGESYFNAGFMIFKNTPLNKELLDGVIVRCEQLDRRDSTYVHGGDQPIFINEYKRVYPNLPPLSNLTTNCMPGFHLPGSPDQLIHFMGIRKPIRTALMDVYAQKIKASLP